MRYLVVLLLLFFSLGIDGASVQLSDQKIEEYVRSAHSKGQSQEEIVLGLVNQGVTQGQIEKLKQSYGEEARAGVATVESDDRSRRDSEPVVVYKAAESGASRARAVFGREIFNNPKLSFEPQLNIPTPENYKLGSNDEVIIDIWGDTEMTIRKVITPEGNITVEGLGPVYLSGLTIKEANSRVRELFGRIHQDLDSDSPRTDIKLTLGQIRSIRVNILGEVTMPGTYTLPSLATVFHALYSAGGANETGTIRNIKVYRAGKMIQEVDVYNYLMTGDDSADITLQDGDNIIVNPFEKLVTVRGEVKRAMRYEMKKGEKLAALIEYAGGYSSSAYRKNLTLTRKGDTEYKIFTVGREEIAKFELSDGDLVEIGAILDRFENRVSISGAVYRPGSFALSPELSTLSGLLDYAEGVKGDAFLERALLYRENPDLSRRVESIDLQGLLSGRGSDIELQRNDSLYVPSIYSIREGQYITVYGEVKRPNDYPFIENMSIEEVVLQAGGLLESASVIRVDVSRRVKNPHSLTEAESEAKIFQLALKDGLIIEGPKDFVLEPFDEVFIRRSPGYVEQENVFAVGEVMFSGGYSKVIANERVSSLIERAGGLTSKAYVRGARIERQLNADERRRVETVLKLVYGGVAEGDSLSRGMLEMSDRYYVGIELDKAIENPGSDYDLVLREGDRLIVPVYTNTVKINGAVMYPNTVVYNPNKKLKQYVSDAGGFAHRAKKSGTYIIYMNGMVAKRKGNSARQIEPGCEIVVPMKPMKRPMSLAEIMSLTTSTTSIAALVTSIVNSTK